VEANPEGLILIQSGDKIARVIIYPFYLGQPITCEQFIHQLPTLFASVFPNARIQDTRRVQKLPDAVVSLMSYSANGKIGLANLLCWIDGRNGMFFAIAAPQERFNSQKETMVKVLETFVIIQPSIYTQWQDPKEYAFSLVLPRNWKVTGGLFRFAPLDTRPALEAISPDAQIRITVGDAEIPPFAVPNPSIGFREGSLHPVAGVRMMVMRYMPGVTFAKWYVMNKVTRGYSDLTFIEVRDRPDTVQIFNTIGAQFGLPGYYSRMSAGEVAFTCKKFGQLIHGYYFAATHLTQLIGIAGWGVPYLNGYLASAGKVGEAQSAFKLMMKSFRWNIQWLNMQIGIASGAGRIEAGAQEAISNIINDAYWNRQLVMDELSRKYQNMILGQTDTEDPLTGEKFKVAIGHNYYWRKEGTDVIVGTPIYEPPDIDFRPLKEYQPKIDFK